MFSSIPKLMHAVILTGHGDMDKLEYKTNIDVPVPKDDEVLIRIKGDGINNTDINTRTGWYSKSSVENADDGNWSGNPLYFPIIQGADICGIVVAVGSSIDNKRIGERVIVRTMQTVPKNKNNFSAWTVGSECNGGFAQYASIRSSEAFLINSNWTDADIASIPCAYSTAEGLLHRSQVKEEKVFITGASGGVGSAAIQLAKLRGATIIAQCSSKKKDEVKKIGADKVVFRESNLIEEIGKNSVDVVIDVVAGSNWKQLLDILKPGGRYATSGAIAGPIVELHVRTLYLKDLTLYGCTHQPKEVFTNLIGYIERNEIRPLVEKTYPLQDIKKAQEDFLSKKYIGKLVLIPPNDNI
jgi:NADPH:quinone reductase-like Zn-dependent oxidoreductase